MDSPMFFEKKLNHTLCNTGIITKPGKKKTSITETYYLLVEGTPGRDRHLEPPERSSSTAVFLSPNLIIPYSDLWYYVLYVYPVFVKETSSKEFKLLLCVFP